MAKNIFKKSEEKFKNQLENLTKEEIENLKKTGEMLVDFSKGKRVNIDNSITYSNNLNKFSIIIQEMIEEALTPIKEKGEIISKEFEEVVSIIESHTGKKITSFEDLTQEVQKIMNYEDLDNITIGELFKDIRNLPPVIKEALEVFSVSGIFIDANLPPAKSNINDISNRIKLSLYEERVLNGLLYLLALNSDRNIKSDKYYLGNGEARIKVNRNSTLIQPNLNINLNDLCREILNKKRISGRDKIEVNEAIENLCSKKINYTKKVKGGNFNFTGSLITKWGEGELLNKPIISIGFNPIFIADLKTKFIKRKRNLFRELDKASPKRLKNSTYFLVKYIERAMSNKSYTQQIYKENLLEVLDIKNERKARREDKLKEALEVCMKINLLEKYSIEKASQGDKFILNINPKYLS
jgi:hypothetical protein